MVIFFRKSWHEFSWVRWVWPWKLAFYLYILYLHAQTVHQFFVWYSDKNCNPLLEMRRTFMKGKLFEPSRVPLIRIRLFRILPYLEPKTTCLGFALKVAEFSLISSLKPLALDLPLRWLNGFRTRSCWCDSARAQGLQKQICRRYSDLFFAQCPLHVCYFSSLLDAVCWWL